MKWINRNDIEPSYDAKITVWNQDPLYVGAVSAYFDYDDWVDVIDKNTLNFIYWQYSPKDPRE